MRLFRRTPPPQEVVERRPKPIALSSALVEYISVVNTVSDVEDPTYRAAVEQLREGGAAIVAEIEEASLRTSGGEEALRRGLLMAAAEIPVPESVRFLRSEALRASPSGTSSHEPSGCLESRAALHEESLRSQAVEGLEALAHHGVSEAVEALAGCARSSSLTVRAVAFAALAKIDGAAGVRERALAELDSDDRYLAEFRRVDVRDVEQVSDPRRHLTGKRFDELAPPGIDDTEPWTSTRAPTPSVTKEFPDG